MTKSDGVSNVLYGYGDLLVPSINLGRIAIKDWIKDCKFVSFMFSFLQIVSQN